MAADETYFAEMLAAFRWWEERLDTLLRGLRARLEADAEQFGFDNLLGYYDELRRAGELQLLADQIAGHLSAGRIPLTAAERDLLHELLYKFEVPDAIYGNMVKRDQIMAKLNVLEADS
ncbi:hypothetical protein ACWCW7_17725 [Nocardia tengchongensis]